MSGSGSRGSFFSSQPHSWASRAGKSTTESRTPKLISVVPKDKPAFHKIFIASLFTQCNFWGEKVIVTSIIFMPLSLISPNTILLTHSKYKQ